MQEVTVDVEEVDPVVLDVDEMTAPDLLEEGLRLRHGSVPDVSSARFAASVPCARAGRAGDHGCSDDYRLVTYCELSQQ